MKQYFWCGKNSTSFRTLSEWLRDREEFKNSGDTFRGRKADNQVTGLFGGTGQLPSDWARTFTERMNAGVIEYVVYSYNTPIAWYDSAFGGWVQPDHTYSVTTSAKHQGPTRTAISVLED